MKKIIYITTLMVFTSCATVSENIVSNVELEIVSEKRAGFIKREYKAVSSGFFYPSYFIEVYKDIGNVGDTIKVVKIKTNRYKISNIKCAN